MNTSSDSSLSLRRLVYLLLIVVSAAMAVGRILSTELVYEPSLSVDWPNDPGHPRRSWPATPPRAMPTFSSNDRSRWAAVRALVDEGTWVVGRRDKQTVIASVPAALAAGDPLQLAVLCQAGYDCRIKSDRGIIFEDGWGSVDKMLNPATLEFYSTKPPLLTFLVAGEYALLKKLFGWSLDSGDCFSIVRVCLLTFNLLPFVVYLWLLVRLVEHFGATDWGRLFVVAAACFATLMTPFLITLNNHTLATCSVIVAVYAAVRIYSASRPHLLPTAAADAADPPGMTWWRWFILAGFAGLLAGVVAVFTPINEVVAAALVAVGTALFVIGAVYATVRLQPAVDAAGSPRIWFVVAGFFAGFTAVNELPAAAFAALLGSLLLVRFPRRTLTAFLPAALAPIALLGLLNWAEMGDPLDLGYRKFGTEWYEYEGSHWRNLPDKSKRGIDWAKNTENRVVYALNLLFGHHGLFSLTPIYVLAMAGTRLGARRLSGGRQPPERSLRGLTPPAQPSRLWAQVAVSTKFLSIIVIGYYIYKSDNYGGWSNGPRWLLWLSPLLLLTLLPIVDRLSQRRWGRILCLVLLGLSVLSAHYWNWNPWRHPWIYNWMDSRGWIPY